MKLTENFMLHEFLSLRDKGEPTESNIYFLRQLAQRLQTLRDLIDRPIIITSGFRSPNYNRIIGGAKNSQHCLGKAADIKVVGMEHTELQHLLRNWSGGLGCYDTFTHVDIREGRARW